MVIIQSTDAMNTKEQLMGTAGSLSKSTQKLSGGYKINPADDNAANVDIAEKLRYQIREAERKYDNIQEESSYCQTADIALGSIQRKLQKINELAVKASDGTISTTDRYYINEEIKQIKLEIQRICENTKFNDDYVFKDDDDMTFSGDTEDVALKVPNSGGIAYNGKRYSWVSINPAMYDSQTGMFNAGTYTIEADDGTTLQLICQTGSEPPQVIRQFAVAGGFQRQTLSVESLGIGDLDILSDEGVADVIGKVGDAIDAVESIRDMYGEYRNTLEDAYIVDKNTSDADISTDMVGYFNTNILTQAAYSVLAQANQSNQGALGLLA